MKIQPFHTLYAKPPVFFRSRGFCLFLFEATAALNAGCRTITDTGDISHDGLRFSYVGVCRCHDKYKRFLCKNDPSIKNHIVIESSLMSHFHILIQNVGNDGSSLVLDHQLDHSSACLL